MIKYAAHRELKVYAEQRLQLSRGLGGRLFSKRSWANAYQFAPDGNSELTLARYLTGGVADRGSSLEYISQALCASWPKGVLISEDLYVGASAILEKPPVGGYFCEEEVFYAVGGEAGPKIDDLEYCWDEMTSDDFIMYLAELDGMSAPRVDDIIPLVRAVMLPIFSGESLVMLELI